MKTHSFIESLESRIAPASLVLTDQDGDTIRFTTSRGDLTGLVTASIVAGVGSVYSVNISSPEFDGAGLTVSVTKAPLGDGIAIIGNIQAGANNLGAVKIKGDLGSIDAGNDNDTIAAIRSLTLNSFGRFGVYGSGDGLSAINGNLTALVVKRDFAKAYLSVAGDVGSIRIGGSMIGGPAAHQGHVFAAGSIGPVIIGGDLRGGDLDFTGRISAGADIQSVSIRGSVFGGSGTNSGQIAAGLLEAGTIGNVKIGGSLVGGAGTYSGTIGASLAPVVSVEIERITIGGDVVGGGNFFAGGIQAVSGTIGILKIKGSFIGGAADSSALIQASEGIETLFIGGHVFGGPGAKNTRITTAEIGTVTIGKSFVGGHGLNSGEIFTSGDIGKITIGGDLRGGDDDYCGSIVAGGNINQAIVKGSMYGGSGTNSGSISAAYLKDGEIGSLTVVGSVFGGTGAGSGTIGGHEANFPGHAVSLGRVTIGGDLIGGSAAEAGSVTAFQGSLGRLTIKGSVIGGTDPVILANQRAGTILLGGSLLSASIGLVNGADSITVRGSLVGGAADFSGSILVSSGGIGVLRILDDVRGGSGQSSGSVIVLSGGIGTIVIGGAVIPGTGSMSGVILE